MSHRETIKRLTESVAREDNAKKLLGITKKWEETGLLEGLEDRQNQRLKSNMAVLLENQAKQLLKEASTMAGGDVEGVAANSFPIVRRIFGGLIANDLVSVQPMSLPAGLIFFLDFQRTGSKLGDSANDSVYGQGIVGSQITGGVSLVGANAEKGFYNLSNGYTSPTASISATPTIRASGTAGGGTGSYTGDADYTALGDRLVRHDPDLVADSTPVVLVTVPKSSFTNFNFDNLVAVNCTPGDGRLQRRLTVEDPITSSNLMFVYAASGSETTDVLSASADASTAFGYPTKDGFTNGSSISTVVGTTPWGLENTQNIPEIDIRVDSVSVTADTKKLKAKWTPELQQDINAFQNLDAEVELTSVLSEHIALEIDREIIEDLIKGATAATYYWSRRPGRFVNVATGLPVVDAANESVMGADFTGNVSMWYETLVERINDVSAQIFRKTLRGGASFIVTSPEVANILEFTSGFRASTTHDEAKGTVGAVKVAQMNKKWDVYVDPYFPRNLILVGRKGSSFLESGYVYAPYVPLQITPTILGTEDFVPRKGVMTRYAKKMIRPDMYGLVVVQDLQG